MRWTCLYSAGKRTTVTAALLTMALIGLVPSEARANIIVANTGTIDPEGSLFRWSYRVTIEPDQEIQTGSVFTIFDFDGLVYDNAAFDTTETAGWTFAPTTTGILAGPPDDGVRPNLNWSYSGATIPSGTTETFIGNFSALSLYDNLVEGFFAGLAYDETTGDVMLNAPGDPQIFVPFAPEQVDVVPEPGSMLLLGTGLFGVAKAIRRRRKNQG